MTSLSTNSLMSHLAHKPPIMDRTHYSSPSGGSSSYYSHSNSKGGKKHSIALTALTLLSFLFFLNILQQCLQDHMNQMNPQVVVMQAKIQRIREAQKRKGETELTNNSTDLSGRNNKPEMRTTKPVQEVAQIPIKLKTKNTKP